ncbi:hypothetical protein CCMSSC00406_0000978 [Pleurotus cornucopiae]|uniref:Uncharacterized protein n=1 Tax=Pleurotus cornucopiae TaxID=5321 RepID=A0ACB7IN05_PLECO|nr:hypothetical protein CCMSSC00406_0000978 [Pleurotus cornucopiae]
MPSHNRSKRNRNHTKGQDDERLLATRAAGDDSSYKESYSRRQGDNYRPSSTQSRHYDSDREPLPSRSHPPSWRDADVHDRYEPLSSDPYLRNGRDDYDAVDSREMDGWVGRGSSESRYERSNEDWSRRYESSYASSSYAEPSAWRSSTYEDRSTSYTSWVPEARTSRVIEEPLVERDSPTRRRDDGHSGGGQKWKSDNGWDTRREVREQTWSESKPIDPLVEPSPEDRTWEPAPGWQPPERRDSHHNHSQNDKQSHSSKNGNRNHRPKGKKSKRNSDQNTLQKRERERDWRTDDGDFNNWQRRDVAPVQTATKKSNRATLAVEAGLRRQLHPLPSADDEHQVLHDPLQLVSADVLVGSSRTSGRHPDRHLVAVWMAADLATEVHLLCQVQQGVHEARARMVNQNRRASKKSKSKSNGKSRNNAETLTRHPLPLNPSHAAEMPPPSTIPSPHNHITVAPDPVLPMTITPEQKREPVSPKASKPKSAGFKPIGQTSSALKRFFPADDDDDIIPKVAQPQITHWVPEPSAQLPLRKDNLIISDTLPRGLPPKPLTPLLPPKPPPPLTPIDFLPPNPIRRFRTISPPHVVENVVEKQPTSPPVAFEEEQVTPVGHSEHDIHPPERVGSQDIDIPEYASSEKELYAIVSQVGEGTFGKVYKARNTITKVHVALKRIRMETERDGFPVTAMREIKLLQSLRHDNVVRLYEMMVSNGSVYMVFEYMDHDLTGVLSQTQFSFEDAHLKSLCHQMLAGLAYLHHKGVIHRDIKGSNILLNNRGELKLADFGLARFYHKRRRVDYTNRVITLWYRPPELLFGATVYGPEVDMWSAGCIMLELYTKKPVFQGNDEIHQLDVIYRIFGTPDPQRWRGVGDLPWFELVKPREAMPNHFRELFKKWMSPAALDLAERLLAYDPEQRATATQAMAAPYFTEEEPEAALPTGLATLEGEWHELETKKERARKRRRTEATTQ